MQRPIAASLNDHAARRRPLVRARRGRPRAWSTTCSARPACGPRCCTPATATNSRSAGLCGRRPRHHARAQPQHPHQPRPSSACRRPDHARVRHTQAAIKRNHHARAARVVIESLREVGRRYAMGQIGAPPPRDRRATPPRQEQREPGDCRSGRAAVAAPTVRETPGYPGRCGRIRGVLLCSWAVSAARSRRVQLPL